MTGPTSGPLTILCRYDCGKRGRPGPMTIHERYCKKNPHPAEKIEQPRRACRWCGKASTAGGIAYHERTCASRPASAPGPAPAECRYCHDFSAQPGPLARHEKACRTRI